MSKPDWARLPTETRHPASRRLDMLPTARIVALLLDEDRRGLELARRKARDVARAAELFARSLEGGGRVVFAGAGTSGRNRARVRGGTRSRPRSPGQGAGPLPGARRHLRSRE